MRGACSSGALAVAAAAAATAALGCLPVARACLAQTSVIGQPTCDELVVLLNDTLIGCSHLESAFGLNCTGCECITVAPATENPADTAQLQGALWTLAAAAFMIVGVVVATFTHKVRSREVVLPENERRPLSEEEMAKVRRAQLRMKTRRFSRTMNSLSTTVLPQRAIIQASNDAINASLKKPVTTAFLNFSAARMAAQRLKHSVSQRTGDAGAAGNSEQDGVYTVGSLSDLGQLDSNNTPGATKRRRTPSNGPADAAAGSEEEEEEHNVRDPAGGRTAAREGPKVGGGASDSAVSISAPPSVSRQGTVLVAEAAAAAAAAAGDGGVARAISDSGGVAAVVPRAGPTAREREAKMSPPPEAKTTTPEGKTAATGSRGSSREAKTGGGPPPHISEGEGARSPPPASSMLSRPGTGNSKSGRRSSKNGSTAQLSPGGDSVGGRLTPSTPGNSKTVTPEPRASDGGGGGSRPSPDRQHSLGLYNQASSPEGAALNPLSVHAAAAAAAAGGSNGGTTGLSSSATLRGQVPVQRLGSGGCNGGVQRLSSDGVLNRIATAYDLEAPPVRRIDSSHFGTGSPTFKQQR